MTSTGVTFDQMLTTVKKAAAALRDAGVPFALAGGLATWARGSVQPRDDDIDFFVRGDDAERALAALVDSGMRAERPPEGWLLKAYEGRALVDLIFDPSGIDVQEVLAAAEELSVDAMPMPVASVDHIVITQLLSWNDHHLDFAGMLEQTRTVREQMDWERVRDLTKSSPYARAF